MATYDSLISRTPGTDPLVPEPMVAEVIQEATKASAILSMARRVTMSSQTQRMPVLSTLPIAGWVNGDTGLKGTTAAEWENVSLVAEEIATIVAVPEAYIADSGVPIWDEVRPRIAEAIGKTIDQACIFGIGKPTTFGTSIVEAADAAGNVVTQGAGPDLAHDVAGLGVLLTRQGYSLNGFVSNPSMHWELMQARDGDGKPIYYTDVRAGEGSKQLYGRALNEVENGAWDYGKAVLIGGDFSKAIVGIRQDITVTTDGSAVISDENGKVILNLFQQDSVALRVVMRLGFAVANPTTTLSDNGAPFAYLAPKAPKTATAK